MRLDRILCLANSYKHDNRCVAGLSLVTGKWVRLLGRKSPRSLTLGEARYPDGKELCLLDVFELEIEADCPSNHHPEDVRIAGTPWKKIRRFDAQRDLEILKAALKSEPLVLHGYGDRIDARKLATNMTPSSLELLEPGDLWWWIREESGKRRYRANFRLGQDERFRYDLPVTDPAWLDQLYLLPTAIHPHSLLCANRHTHTFLTASLSEPFEGFHYKLIAGVINLPA